MAMQNLVEFIADLSAPHILLALDQAPIEIFAAFTRNCTGICKVPIRWPSPPPDLPTKHFHFCPWCFPGLMYIGERHMP